MQFVAVGALTHRTVVLCGGPGVPPRRKSARRMAGASVCEVPSLPYAELRRRQPARPMGTRTIVAGSGVRPR